MKISLNFVAVITDYFLMNCRLLMLFSKEDVIKRILKEAGCKCVDEIYLPQNSD
jgi:hypothetical protein